MPLRSGSNRLPRPPYRGGGAGGASRLTPVNFIISGCRGAEPRGAEIGPRRAAPAAVRAPRGARLGLRGVRDRVKPRGNGDVLEAPACARTSPEKFGRLEPRRYRARGVDRTSHSGRGLIAPRRTVPPRSLDWERPCASYERPQGLHCCSPPSAPPANPRRPASADLPTKVLCEFGVRAWGIRCAKADFGRSAAPGPLTGCKII